MSNEKKNATLGMHHGTAAGRLRKILLFDCLQRHNENVCVRCGKTISTADELSIEHLKPWEGVSAELFWDLKNIAYSHLGCNRPHSYPKQTAKRRIAPPGMVWCYICKDFEPTSEFDKNTARWTGYQAFCRKRRPDRN